MHTHIESGSPTHPIIVLIDDSPEDLHLHRIILEKLGIKADIRCFENGLPALAFIRQSIRQEKAPDLLITDWHMPGFQGSSLIRCLEQEQLERFPVAILSGSFAIDAPHPAIQSQIDVVYEKAISIETTLHQFRQIILTFLPHLLTSTAPKHPSRTLA